MSAVSNDTTPAGAGSAPEAPAIRVTGDATPEELAALVAVLSALGGADPAPDGAARARSAWSDPSWALVGPARAGAGWRTSGLPR